MTLEGFVEGFGIFMIAFFALLNGTYLLFTAMAWRMITEYQRSRSHHAVEEAFASPLTPPISIFMPAYNESASIVESVRSVLSSWSRPQPWRGKGSPTHRSGAPSSPPAIPSWS
jgi:cellulose synthase/poly-beta-1,6-N-acetylglucosamine synthase-like glycosyltransferase